jgi:SAM-dependent methyltransferase
MRRLFRRRGPYDHVLEPTDEDRRYFYSRFDDSISLPDGAEEFLSEDNPRLRELREAYASLDLPALDSSRWTRAAVAEGLDLRWFRGDTLITWHYRESRRVTELKYFVLARYVQDRDPRGLLAKLGEDGAFGCWTFSYPGYGRVSRDLLDSVNEISFLERELGLSSQERFSVLDIGAGYGRLAHRMAGAYPQLDDYCCVDAVPESTFLSEYYLRHRSCSPPARIVSLDALDSDLRPGAFDLALNIHSFSECPLAAVEWWVEMLGRLRVRHLLVVPDDPARLLTLEPDGSTRLDFAPALERAGYRLSRREPVIDDAAVAELLELKDCFNLFSLQG